MPSNTENTRPQPHDFEVLIDAPFLELFEDTELVPVENKFVLSLLNDFEDQKWRFDKFQNFIWDNVAETALSFQERQSLVNRSQTSLIQAAQKLRLTDRGSDDFGTGSEIAEIVLYGIMKHYYAALPVVPKIFYKQNSQDNAKGADSVHIVVEDDGDFSLWFGEAKFYNSIEDVRLPSIIESVKKSLETEKLKKENSIIVGVSDLDSLVEDEELRRKIKSTLSYGVSIDNIKPKLNIPILLLHECKATKEQRTADESYKNNLREFHKNRAENYFKKQIASCSDISMYSQIKFHLILFPVPEKEPIVSKFVQHASFYKGE